MTASRLQVREKTRGVSRGLSDRGTLVLISIYGTRGTNKLSTASVLFRSTTNLTYNFGTCVLCYGLTTAVLQALPDGCQLVVDELLHSGLLHLFTMYGEY